MSGEILPCELVVDTKMLQQLTAGYQGKKFQMKAKNADRSTSTGDVDPCAQGKRTLSASDSGPTPRRVKRDFVSVHYALEGDFLSVNGLFWPRTLGSPHLRGARSCWSETGWRLF